MVALAPIFQQIDSDRKLTEILFLTFLAVNIIITFIGLVNLSKQLLIKYFLDEVQVLEEEIRKKLGDINTKTFRSIDNWNSNFMHSQLKLAKIFTVLMYLVTIFFPTIILYQYCAGIPNCGYYGYSFSYSLIYCVLALFLVVVHIYAAKAVLGKLSDKLGRVI